ncbi:MAG TPA: arylamine N-acetyltransferase [Longimicrobium sp.]|nr:arylamine N-acetyltransferase [Longimicrobium sp.]
MTTTFDLDAYLRRIGYGGGRAPTLDTLRAIHQLHAQSIPFENLDPLLRRPMQLDAEWLQQKLVHDRRGGWCFEQNHVLRGALTALGFRTTGLAARVMWNVPEKVVTARGHMLLLVHLDEGSHLADVGFGGLTLTAPLRLVADVEQPTPHETFRLAAQGDGYVMQARIGEEWKPLYRFTLDEVHPPDYEVSSWYLSTHPRSHFLAGLMVARPAPEGRHALRNTTLTTHHRDGRTERRQLESAAELRDVLHATFGIAAPDELEDAFEMLRAAG